MGTKKKIRGRGSGISYKDIGKTRKQIPSHDSDYNWEVMRRIKIPPARIPAEITKEQFVEELQFQPEDSAEISTEDFISMLKDPKYRQRRQQRTQRERYMAQMEYFDLQDERQWVNDQMKLLYFVDEQRYIQDQIIYNCRIRNLMERIEKRYKQLKREDPELAGVFAEAGWKYIDSIKKPKKKFAGSRVIIRQQRRYALEGKYFEMHSLAKDLKPILDEE